MSEHYESLERPPLERAQLAQLDGVHRLQPDGAPPEDVLRPGRRAALPRVAFFFFHEVDRGSGHGFVDVAAAEAGAVGAVPIAFDDHRAAAAGAGAGQIRRAHVRYPFQSPNGPQSSAHAEVSEIAWHRAR